MFRMHVGIRNANDPVTHNVTVTPFYSSCVYLEKFNT